MKRPDIELVFVVINTALLLLIALVVGAWAAAKIILAWRGT